MKVVILCGGLGTRLETETTSKPKPMVEIGGRPILWHIMKIYSYWGYSEFILALGYKSEIIKNYFMFYRENTGSIEVDMRTSEVNYLHESEDLDWKVKMIETGTNTLKGGRIKRIERYIDTDTFMLTYGDGVANINIPNLLTKHKGSKKVGTITGVNPPSRFGEIITDEDDILSFSEKPQVSLGLINGGFFVLEREIFDYLTPDEKCDFEKGPLEEIAREGKLGVYKHPGMWECMDTVRDMNYLNRLWNENKAFWKVWK